MCTPSADVVQLRNCNECPQNEVLVEHKACADDEDDETVEPAEPSCDNPKPKPSLQCKVGHYSNYGAIIEILECPPLKTEFCIAYGCQKEPNDVYMAWQCSESDKCPDLSGANDFGGLNLTGCECKIGEKDTNLGNENFTFPIDDPAGSDEDGAYHNSMDSPDSGNEHCTLSLELAGALALILNADLAVTDADSRIQINKHEEEYGMSGASPFTFVMEFKNRICWNLMQSHTPPTFNYIKLTLSGDCGRAKFGLPNLIAYTGRVQELRGVQLDLKNRKVTQWHNPFEPIDGYESKRMKKSNYQWQSTDLDMIDEYGHQKILSDIEKEARMNESDYD
ncbi:hypothetical protein niasHT_038545 [Heterodera trifolii]|uniref:Uncharacterized protein n=1 Tax=Heterodera trifolii TaxID=157864 RepID=A0ABD2I2Z4_9BILA